MGRVIKWLMVLNFLCAAGWATYGTVIATGAADPSAASAGPWTEHVLPWLYSFGVVFGLGTAGVAGLASIVLVVTVLYFAFFAKEEKKTETAPAAPKEHPYRRKNRTNK